MSTAIERADEAVKFYSKFNGRSACESTVMDMLADLMLWCDQEGIDFNAALKDAQENFETERGL